jgi:hypothetical protein
MRATSIELGDEISDGNSDQIEVLGFVTDIASDTEFTVGDQLVQTDFDTVFDGGTPDDIVPGVLLEIKGVPVDVEHSVLAADKVSFEVN